MNPFADLLKDKVFIVTGDGARKGPFKTNLRDGKATIFVKHLKVAQGDTLVRPLSDGDEEVYTIEDFQYAEGLMDIPESFTFILNPECILVPAGAAKDNRLPARSNDTEKFQHIQSVFEELIHKIDTGNTPVEDKIIAKSKIRELLTNPTISSLLGAEAATLLKLL